MNLNKVLTIILLLLIALSSYFTIIVHEDGLECMSNALVYGASEVEDNLGEELYCTCSVISEKYYTPLYFNGKGYLK